MENRCKWATYAASCAAAAMCAVLIASCGSDAETAPSGDVPAHLLEAATPRPGGRIVIGVQQEPERLSEILSGTATTHHVCNLVFSRFVKYDDHMRLVPDVITEIPTVANGGVSADYRTITYHLRRDVRWHDGEPLTSADVAFTYEVIMNPDVNVETRDGWEVVASLETPDPYTVVFHLNVPFPAFVAGTFYDESILPRHILADEVGEQFHLSTFHHAPIGSGPFKVVEWSKGSHLILTRNDDYYLEGPYLDEIIYRFVPDDNTLLVQLKTGEIDLFDNASSSFADDIRAMDNVKMYATPTLMYEHIDLNTEHPALADRRVRQAIALAIDKVSIASDVYHGFAEVAPLDEHPSSQFFNADAASRTAFDAVAARRLLRDAGWVDSDGDGIRDQDGRPLTLSISATAGNPNRERTEVVLQQQLREVGIDLEIRNYNPAVLYGSYDDGGVMKRGKFDLLMYAWLSSPDPADKDGVYGSNKIPPAGQNHARIRNEALTTLLVDAARELDPERRREMYFAAADILVDEAPVVPLFWYTAVDVATRKLRNYRPNPTLSSDTWNAHQWYVSE